MKIKKAGNGLFLLLLIAFAVWGCGEQEEKGAGKVYHIYYINKEETAVLSQEYVTETTDTQMLLAELLEQLGKVSGKLEYKTPLSDNLQILSHAITEDQLILSFDESYKQQEVTTEVVVRAAIVRTLTQIDGIKYVSFQVKSEDLTDAYGAVIGMMTADMFIDNAGDEINTYEKVKLTLYLANETGNGLKTVSRPVVYNSNVPMERLVVEQLFAGPSENEKAYPAVNPDTKILSVNVKDGVCYVDLDNMFLTQIYNVTPEVTIYSITNSLVELPNINKVQISVNGDTSVSYKENMSLSTVFERNLELVENGG